MAKKNLATTSSRDERLRFVDWDYLDLSIKKQTGLLSLNHSGLYYTPVLPSLEELTIKQCHYRMVYTNYHPFYGSRRIDYLYA